MVADSWSARARIWCGKAERIDIISSAVIGPPLCCIICVMVSLSHLNLTVSAQAMKKAAAVSNGPPMPGMGPEE